MRKAVRITGWATVLILGSVTLRVIVHLFVSTIEGELDLLDMVRAGLGVLAALGAYSVYKALLKQ